MSDLINKLFNKNYDDAKSLFEEKMSSIVEKKKVENKKVIGAKLEQLTMTRKAFDGNTGARAEKLYRDVIEEKGPGLWANIRAKKARGERMRKPGEEGAPTEEQIKKARNEEVELEEKYGKGYVSAASKIERAMKKRGVQPNSSDKYRKEMERLDAQYKELQAKDKKIDEEEQTTWLNPLDWPSKIKKANQAALDKAGITSQDYKDLAKNILPSAAKATADVVGKIATEKGQERNLEKTIDQTLPVNAGTMTKHMMGLTTGIKDSDKFRDDERKAILDVSAKAHEKSKGVKQPGAQYYQTQKDTDYDDKEYSNVGKKGGMFGSNLMQMAKGTADQSEKGAQYRVHTTLGGFGFKPTNKGLEVRDTYNFDNLSKDKKADSAYLKVRQAGEKADEKYADSPEKQQTKFTIPRSELEKDPYWSRVYAPTDRRAYQAPSEPKKAAPARPITPTPSTAYKAVSEPKAMTQATPKTVSAQPKPRSEIGKQFDAAYADAKKLSKTSGQKTFSFKGKDYALNEDVELDEARINIIKARIRGGKVQRRKKVSNVPGMTLRSGKLIRMSPAERRRRRMGQKRGKIKRRMKLGRTLVKRQRSLRKRQSLGLK